MSYYKPTTFAQKVFKILQLFYYSIIQSSGKLRKRKPAHTSILMIVSKLDRIGGLEHQALELSAALIQQGCLITILTDRIDHSPSEEFRSGFLIRRLTFSTNPIRLLTSIFCFFFRQNDQYQLVHIHGITGFTIVAARVARFFGMKTIFKSATQDDFNSIFQQKGWKQRLYAKWILHADCMVAISQGIKHEMLDNGIPENRIRMLPNAVNTDRFHPPSNNRKISLRKKLQAPTDQILFLYLGRLEKRKGVDFLLDAWQKCSPGILWIVGSGAEEQRLKNICSDHRSTNVVFHGETRTPLDYYQAADVFVFPSLKEGSPGVILEAMSCALPCIATSIPGILEQIENGKQGRLVSPGNSDELAAAMVETANDASNRSGWSTEARETAVEFFDVNRIAAAYKKLYQELLTSSL